MQELLLDNDCLWSFVNIFISFNFYRKIQIYTKMKLLKLEDESVCL